jgi:hypothetical protein
VQCAAWPNSHASIGVVPVIVESVIARHRNLSRAQR